MNLPGTSMFIYGIQEEDFDPAALPQAMGWVMGYAEIGDNPEPHPGVDYSYWKDRGFGTLCRLQYRWGNQKGTLPRPENLDAYVERVRTCVQNSRGVYHWQVGNETNIPVEWPEGWKLMPEYVADCFNQVEQAIHSVTGHAFDEVMPPPVGPWNDQVGMGWIEYWYRMLVNCENPTAIACHSYTHGYDPALIRSEAMMNPPYENCHYNFRAYRDFLGAVPEEFRHLPAYITETDQYETWRDQANGWVPEAYREINEWNWGPDSQVIRALFLYRWSGDKWHIKDKQGVIEDFLTAQEYMYEWPQETIPPDPDQPRILSIRQTITLNWSNGDTQTFSGTLEEET